MPRTLFFLLMAQKKETKKRAWAVKKMPKPSFANLVAKNMSWFLSSVQDHRHADRFFADYPGANSGFCGIFFKAANTNTWLIFQKTVSVSV